MDIANTLQLLARNCELCAWRDRGIIIRVRAGLVIERVAVAKPYRWQPSYQDLIADDWQTGTFDELRAQSAQLGAPQA